MKKNIFTLVLCISVIIICCSCGSNSKKPNIINNIHSSTKGEKTTVSLTTLYPETTTHSAPKPTATKPTEVPTQSVKPATKPALISTSSSTKKPTTNPPTQSTTTVKPFDNSSILGVWKLTETFSDTTITMNTIAIFDFENVYKEGNDYGVYSYDEKKKEIRIDLEEGRNWHFVGEVKTISPTKFVCEMTLNGVTTYRTYESVIDY